MSYYVSESGLSYFDYLQAKSFENSFKTEISKRTRSIIASNEELQQQHIAAMESVSSGIERLSFDIQELTVAFQWGFGELLAAVGRVNDTLASLVKIAKTPAQVWAYEQFEIARDAFRQELYQEALESLDRAINGYSSNTGHKLEYRFHYLLGTIRLGSFQNSSPAIVNLAEAENAFQSAARYARRDYPTEAGHALLAAGWAAYCQGKMMEAARHTEEAAQLVPQLGEAYFQLAKIQFHIGEPDSALPNLGRAIKLDRAYSIRAASDDDFKRYEAKIHALIDELRQSAQQEAEALLVATERQTIETEKRQVQEFSLPKYVGLDSAKHDLLEATSAARHNTYFGYLDSATLCLRVRQQLQHALAQFTERANADALQQITRLDDRINTVRTRNAGGGWVAMGWLGVILSFVLGCQSYNRVSKANDQQKQIRLDAAYKQMAELRSKGYDPAKLSVQQADKILGDNAVESLPPWNTGVSPLGMWFLCSIGGSVLAIVIVVVGDRTLRARAIAPLERDKLRLQRIRSELGYT